MNRIIKFLICLGLGLGLVLPRSAEAQDAGAHDPDAGAPPSLEPPALISAVDPVFPEAARAAGLREGEVVLRVTVDAAGQVTSAEVLESTAPSFDEAARVAALGYRFAPARRDGASVSARVMLRIALHAPPEPVKEPEPAPVAPPPSPPPAKAVEVRVEGSVSEADRLRRSAEAVQVVDTEQARRRTADMGEVLARTQGVAVQRSAGLGSTARLSLNGLTDDQIRFYLDGVPLELSGYPFGLANVPVNLVERVEIYRGVVPIRFGADALGGAINLVSDADVHGTHATGSYQTGSFGVHRLTASARHLHEPSGFFTRASAFVDRADNDYPMSIEVPDDVGREVPARVYRFHDGYAAQGGNLELGVVDRPYADRLLLRAFVTDYDKEIQHNFRMSRVYGDVELGELSAGGTLRYEHGFAHGISTSLVAGYAYSVLSYEDVSDCVYDWFGRCVKRDSPGEVVNRPQDQRFWEHNAYGRANVAWQVRPEHTLRLSVSPTYTKREGDERREADPSQRDALSARRSLLALVNGLEYQLELAGGRLENVLFVKQYLQVLRSEDPLQGGRFRREDRNTQHAGAGDSLRYAFLRTLYAKLSYEWATRLPRADEIFGNAFPIQPNLELEPEISHNVNLGVTLERLATPIGVLRGDVNGFVRAADQLILLVGNDQRALYQNVFSARSTGVEAAAGWTSPGEYVALDGNATYVDFRNTSSHGAFASNEGQRIPNRPYLFASGNARIQLREVAATNDELALDWTTRYVGEFLRGWAGIGDGDTKLKIAPQLLHTMALGYLVEGPSATLSFTGEIQNLTDRRAYDFYGVQRPGRAVTFKVTASL